MPEKDMASQRKVGAGAGRGGAVLLAAGIAASCPWATAAANAADLEGFGVLFEPRVETATLAPAPPPQADPPQIMRLAQRLQCVPFARAESGIDLMGDAKTWWRQAAGRYRRDQEPEEGAVLVMAGYAGADRGHVAVVRSVVSEREIRIDHANWLNQGEITVSVPVQDVSKAGDWSRVRVWHIPSRAWGVRVYTAQGFILPDEVLAAAAVGSTAS
jgi:hypothetical protein